MVKTPEVVQSNAIKKELSEQTKTRLTWAGRILFPAVMLLSAAFLGSELFDATFLLSGRIKGDAVRQYPLEYTSQDLANSKNLIADYHRASDKKIEDGANVIDLSEYNKPSSLTLQRALQITDTDQKRNTYQAKYIDGYPQTTQHNIIFGLENVGALILGATGLLGTFVLDVVPLLPEPEKKHRSYYN